MSSLFQNILRLLLIYKYPALFFVAFLSSLGIPLPAGSSTVAAAAFASQGYLNIFLVLIISSIGNILGDISLYILFKKYGKKVLYWFHLRKVAQSKPLEDVKKVKKSYSATVIIISRFQDQATAIVNAIAGLGGMEFKRFALYAIIGDILQVILCSSIGYFFAENWQMLYNALGVFSWLIVLVTIIISILITNKFTKKYLERELLD